MAYGMLVMAILSLCAHGALVRRPPDAVPDVLEDPMTAFLEQLPSESA